MKKLYVIVLTMMLILSACSNVEQSDENVGYIETTSTIEITESVEELVENEVDETTILSDQTTETVQNNDVVSNDETDATVGDSVEETIESKVNEDDANNDAQNNLPTDSTEPTHTSSTEPEETINFEAVNEAVYAKSNVNIRKGPGTEYDRIDCLTKGESVSRIGIGSNGWSKVIYNGEEAYINSKYLTTQKPIENTKPQTSGNKTEHGEAETEPTNPPTTMPPQKPDADTETGISKPPEETVPPTTDHPITEPESTEPPNEGESSTNQGNDAVENEKETAPETNDPSGDNDDDGDTGQTINTTPDIVDQCDPHNMVFEKTEIEVEYELYNYVTNYYKCSRCGNTSSSTKIASANVSDSTITGAENTVVSYLNSLRKSNGLNELWTNSSWNSWADTRAKELAVVYGHNRPNGSSWIYGIENCYSVAENIAAGQSSGYNFYNAFYNSSQHRNAMLIEEAVGVAVGIYVAEDGTTYCAMVLIGEG